MENDLKNQNILASVVWKLAKSGCTIAEIAAFYQISTAEFEKILDKHPQLLKLIDAAQLAGRAEIRAEIHERALRGDTKLLQHRAQHELGQAANTVTVAGDAENPLKIEINFVGTDKN